MVQSGVCLVQWDPGLAAVWQVEVVASELPGQDGKLLIVCVGMPCRKPKAGGTRGGKGRSKQPVEDVEMQDSDVAGVCSTGRLSYSLGS